LLKRFLILLSFIITMKNITLLSLFSLC